MLRTIILGTNAHQFALIMGSTHSKVVAQNGSDIPVLLWVYTATAADNFAKMIASSASAHNFHLDYFEVFDTNLYVDDFTDAVIKNIVPVSGTIVTSAAACLWYLSFNLTSSPSANLVAVELRYRVQNSSNYWSLRIVRNSGNTAWDLLLVRVLGGSPTTFKTVTGVGTPTRLIAAASGNDHESWTDASGTSTLRGLTITNSDHAAQTGASAVWDTSTAVGTLSAWTLENSFYTPYF